MDTSTSKTKQEAFNPANVLQQEPHAEVIEEEPSALSLDEEKLAAGISTIGLQAKRLWSTAENAHERKENEGRHLEGKGTSS
jgi:hypothetical protein